MLSTPPEGKTAGYKPHFNKKQPSFPFDPILKASLNVQSHECDSTSISFPSRTFSSFSNHHDSEKKLFDRIFYDGGKRFDSGCSRADNDRPNGNRHSEEITKTAQIKNPRAFRGTEALRAGNKEKERLSSTTETHAMIPNVEKPEKCTCQTKRVQHLSAPSSSCFSAIHRPGSSVDLLSPRRMTERESQSNATPIPHCHSNDRSVVEALNRKPSQHSDLSFAIKSDDPDKRISYAENMKESSCSGRRFQGEKKYSKHRLPDDRCHIDLSSEPDVSKSSKPISLTREENPSKERIECSLELITKESMKKLTRPNAIKSLGDTSSRYSPKLTTSGDCCFDKTRSPHNVSLLFSLGNRNPNMESFKYRLSKCPDNLHEIWRNCGKPEAAVPPDPLARARKTAPSPSKWIAHKYFRKLGGRGYTETGKWRQQSYNLRQRIYKCMKRANQSDYGVDLDPCPPSIQDSQLYFPSTKYIQFIAKVNGEGRQCTGAPKKNRCSKTYATKMQESRQKIALKKRPRRKIICNRNCS